MRTDTVETFLAQLAARVPAPGGGATAALHAAQAAALVAMVARYSDSAKYADHAEEIATITATADRLRENALGLAEELLPIGNRNVVSDVAAAAEAARAAATTARVNVEVNLGGIPDPATRGELAAVVDTVDDLVLRAEKVTAAVRDGLVR